MRLMDRYVGLYRKVQSPFARPSDRLNHSTHQTMMFEVFTRFILAIEPTLFFHAHFPSTVQCDDLPVIIERKGLAVERCTVFEERGDHFIICRRRRVAICQRVLSLLALVVSGGANDVGEGCHFPNPCLVLV